MDTFMGRQGLVWWEGVVEDVNDPEYLGRVRVRIFGVHTKDKSKIPTEKLPWVSPIMPINSASAGGLGTSPTGVITGSRVVGFFRDGQNLHDPIIFGTVPGKPISAANTTEGLNDPSGTYPPEATPPWKGGSDLGESDVNRLATGQRGAETITQVKKDGVDTNMAFSEPASPAAPQYPYNQVMSTIAGHHQEFDSTPGAERIHTYHTAGSFEEYHPNGDVVRKCVGDSYEVVLGDKFVSVSGNCTVVVAGDVTVKAGGNVDINAGGYAYVTGGPSVKLWGGRIDLNSGSSPSQAYSSGTQAKKEATQQAIGWHEPITLSDSEVEDIQSGQVIEIQNGSDPYDKEALEYGDGGIEDGRRNNKSPVNDVVGPQDANEETDSTFDPASSDLLIFLPHTDPRVSSRLINVAENIARKVGYPLTITSAYRSPAYNKKVGGVKKSIHMKGLAFDVVMSGKSSAQRAAFIKAACDLGIQGIGIYSSFTHIDLGGKRCWGPNGSRTSLHRYQWAQQALRDKQWPGA